MKDVYTKEVVRKAHYRDEKSQRQIARDLGLNRRTVKKLLALGADEVPRYHKSKPKARRVLGDYEAVIAAWLKADEQSPRKQRHTAQRIHERLREEYGFSGSYGAVRDYVRQARQQQPEVFLPLAFAPGEMAQVDWAEVTVWLAGVKTKIQLFGLVLNYSGGFYCEAFHRASQEAFFEGHASAFAFLGGVPRTITYDNLTSAVKKILEGRNREENERFAAYRSAWLFDSRFCQPARGNEKGRIENMVKYAERNFFVPVPQVASLAELNTLLRERCREYQNHIQARQSQSVGERLAEEQRHLLPIPAHPPECCRIVPVKADKFALVQFETNRYSVPSQYAHQSLWLKAFVERIEITNQQDTVAVHPRLTGRFEEAIEAGHYGKVLERKPGAAKHLRTVEKPVLTEKPKPTNRSGYPEVYVRPPDLSIYRQLLRNPDHYDPAPNLSAGKLSQAPAPARHRKTVP